MSRIYQQRNLITSFSTELSDHCLPASTIALIAINNKQPVDPNRLCIRVKVVELGKH